MSKTKLDKDVRDMLPHEKLMASAYAMAVLLKEIRDWMNEFEFQDAPKLIDKITEQLKRSGME